MKRMARFFPGLVMISTLVAMSGCASGATAFPNLAVEAASSSGAVSLYIQNNNWSDVRVYLVPENGGAPRRLGVVRSMGTERLEVRGPTNGYNQILLRPLGSRASYVTNAMVFDGTRGLELTIQNDLALSTLVLR